MFRMNGISRFESRDGLGRAKQDARAESTWMCGAIVSGKSWVTSYPPYEYRKPCCRFGSPETDILRATKREVSMRLSFLILLSCFALAGCAPEPADISDTASTTSTAPLRVAVARFAHETCTFCPGGDSDIERWTRIREPYVGDEVLSASSYVRGFVAAAREYKDVELVGLESPAGVFGGSSASWSTEACCGERGHSGINAPRSCAVARAGKNY